MGVIMESGGQKRRRVAAVAGVLWLLLVLFTRSIVAGTLVALALAVIVAAGFAGLRALGVGKDHPVVRSLATRPWRRGRDVFRLATRRMSDVLIVTPKGARLAPNAIEVRMNPADVDSLAEVIDPELMNMLATEAYEAAITAGEARVLHGGPVDAQVVADPEVPAGRYELRQRRHGRAGLPASASLCARLDGGSVQAAGSVLTRIKVTERDTVFESGHNPLLVLVTGNSRTQTRISGARAGRDSAAELVLPDEPTISRVHGRFTCRGGQWEIAGLGRNGVLVNGTELAGGRPVYDGDLIQWGHQQHAPTSIVQIS